AHSHPDLTLDLQRQSYPSDPCSSATRHASMDIHLRPLHIPFMNRFSAGWLSVIAFKGASSRASIPPTPHGGFACPPMRPGTRAQQPDGSERLSPPESSPLSPHPLCSSRPSPTRRRSRR